MTVGAGVPKFRLLTMPQRSPPELRRSWLCRFCRLQSGEKLLLASVQERVTLTGMLPSGFVPEYRLSATAFWRYLPPLILTAVLPLPNTSHATPPRGVRSW